MAGGRGIIGQEVAGGGREVETYCDSSQSRRGINEGSGRR